MPRMQNPTKSKKRGKTALKNLNFLDKDREMWYHVSMYTISKM